MIVTNTPLAMFLRKGTLTNPYIKITETNRMITDGGTLVLQEFPINQTGYVQESGGDPVQDAVAVSVVLTIDEEDVTFSEIRDASVVLGAEEFRVDYESGIIEFDPTLYGAEVVKTITYAGRGAYYIAASRVYDDTSYTNDLSQDEFTTLQDVLDSVSEISVNSTTTGAPGTNAAVTVTGTSFDFTIPRGEPFTIAAEYASVADLSSETPDVTPSDYEPALFDLVIINTGSVEDEENARLYIYDGEGAEGGFTFVSDMSGATGPVGPVRAYQWDGTSLQWRNDNDTGWDAGQKLSPDIQWDGTQLSVVEPGATPSYVDLGITPSFDGSVLTLSPNDGSPDATYDVGITASWNDTELIISPNDGSPDVSYDLGITPSWNDGTLTITPNDGSTAVSYDLGWDASFTGTTLTFTPDDGSTAISSDLGITPTWDGTELTLTPNVAGSTPVSEDLGITPSWNNSELTLTPNYTGAVGVSKDLGLTFSFDADELTIESNMTDGVDPLYSESVSLGLNYSWDGTELTIQDKVGGPALSQELGTSAEWGDGITETATSVRFQNGDGSYTAYQELGLSAEFSGTTLTITTPEGALDPVDLQADSPTITAEAITVAYTESAAVTVTEPTPNTFNLAFDIPTGEPLNIDVTYASITDMNSNTSPTPSGYTPETFDLAIIQSAEGAENEDNAKLYMYNGAAWTFVSDLSGAKGETGDTGPTGPMPDHQWDGTSLRFELPEGGYGDYVDLKGDTGASLDIGVENTITTLPNLNDLENQKQINQYFEINKVNVQSLSSNILIYPTLTDSTVIPAYYQMIDDLDSLLDATDVHTTNDLTSTGTSLITGNNILVGSFIVDSNLFIGNPGVIGVTTVGNIKKS